MLNVPWVEMGDEIEYRAARWPIPVLLLTKVFWEVKENLNLREQVEEELIRSCSHKFGHGRIAECAPPKYDCRNSELATICRCRVWIILSCRNVNSKGEKISLSSPISLKTDPSKGIQLSIPSLGVPSTRMIDSCHREGTRSQHHTQTNLVMIASLTYTCKGPFIFPNTHLLPFKRPTSLISFSF